MVFYVLKTGIGVAVLPGVGKVRQGQRLYGDRWAEFSHVLEPHVELSPEPEPAAPETIVAPQALEPPPDPPAAAGAPAEAPTEREAPGQGADQPPYRGGSIVRSLRVVGEDDGDEPGTVTYLPEEDESPDESPDAAADALAEAAAEALADALAEAVADIDEEPPAGAAEILFDGPPVGAAEILVGASPAAEHAPSVVVDLALPVEVVAPDRGGRRRRKK